MEDLKCENRCQTQLERMVGAIDKQEIKASIGDNEACHAKCLIPRKGATDQIMCIEKCNTALNSRLTKVLDQSS